MRKSLTNCLRTFFDMLCGDSQPYQPLPAAYYQQPDWSYETQTLQIPAAWRRQPRVR